MKKILLITDGFPFGENEISFISHEYEAMNRYFDVYIIAANHGKEPIRKKIEKSRVKKYNPLKINLFGLINAFLSKKTYDDIAKMFEAKLGVRNTFISFVKIVLYASRAFTIMPTLEKYITTNKIDIIYTFWCLPATLASERLKKKYKNLKVVTRFHGADLFNERIINKWQPFRFEMSDNVDKMIFVSTNGRDYFYRKWGRKGVVVNLGVEKHTLIDYNSSEYVLISCSSIIKLKRVELIVKALSLIEPSYKIKWYHFGDGPERKNVEKLAEKLLSNKSNIIYSFMGYYPNDVLMEMYYRIKPSFFITVSATEGAPVSLQEAISMGIPCIATNVGGIPDIVINGYNGFLINDASAKNVARCIEHSYTIDPGTIKKLKMNSYNHWLNYYDSRKTSLHFIETLLE